MNVVRSLLPAILLAASAAPAAGQQEPIHVLVVDGDPGREGFDGETSYLERVLNRRVSERCPIEARVLTEIPSAVDLDSSDVVILADIPSIEGPSASRLLDFARRGGGVLLFLGDRVQPERYDETLCGALEPPFLPVRLGDRRNLTWDGEGRMPRLCLGDVDHPALRYFQDHEHTRSLFDDTVTHGYYRLREEGLPPAARPLVWFDDPERSPAIVEGAYGEGTVVLVLTSADRSWTTLPGSPVFVPLVDELVAYAAHRR